METVAAVGLVSSIITIVETIKNIYDTAKNAKGLPERVRATARALDFIQDALEKVERQLDEKALSEEEVKRTRPVMETCKKSLETIKDIFEQYMPKGDVGRMRRLTKAAWAELRKKGTEVETNMAVVGQQFQLLAGSQIFKDARVLKDIQSAIEDLQTASDEESVMQFNNHGAGSQNPVLGMHNTQNNNFGTGHMNIECPITYQQSTGT
jgi:Na+/phosphate symporter